LRALVAEQLAAFAAPKRIHYVTDLPRTPLGKVVRAALVEPPVD
jgi:acyl-coenzyme A synthetase/AMP-(fatty) acid ligase